MCDDDQFAGTSHTASRIVQQRHDGLLVGYSDVHALEILFKYIVEVIGFQHLYVLISSRNSFNLESLCEVSLRKRMGEATTYQSVSVYGGMSVQNLDLRINW